MPNYSQAERPLRVSTPLGEDVLLLNGFTGEESISRPFSYRLDLMSTNDAIKAKALLGKPMTITIAQRDGSERSINGLVNRFGQLGRRDELTSYNAQMVCWPWFLSLSRDCKVFQKKTVLEIVETVFTANGFSDFENKCTRSYPQREYCVQYRESHLNFVSRLLEEEGIFYFFRHTASKHILVLADNNRTVAECEGVATARVALQPGFDEDVITTVSREDAVYAGKVTLRDFDPLQPSLSLNNTMSGEGKHEIYDYQPVIYTKLDEGDRYARIMLEAEEAGQQLIQGESTCRSFASGCKFTMEDHYRADMNGVYVLTSVRHEATAGDYRSWEDAPFDYRNEFIAIPEKVPYRPTRQSAKPSVRGSQTAVVVGPSGEEIWTDKHGRVKVQFHWDRDGKKDDHSSCWVRVSSAWAGKGWGAVHIPRIGQEVLVDFIEGDPDRPIITGRVYNAEQVPPYALPTNQTQSGVKSRSSKGGDADNFNEIRLEDKTGEELFYVQAEKDKEVLVKNDRKEEVGNDETIKIGNDRTEEVGNDETIKIGNNRTEEVGKDEKIKIGGKRDEEVTDKENVKIGSDRDHKIDGKETLNVGSSRTSKIGSDDKLEVGSKLTMKANSDIQIQSAGGKIVLQSPTSIELKVGASQIKITPAGIELKSPQIKIQGMAQVELKAPMVNGKADALLKLQGAITQVNGDGVLMAKGGITMIN